MKSNAWIILLQMIIPNKTPPHTHTHTNLVKLAMSLQRTKMSKWPKLSRAQGRNEKETDIKLILVTGKVWQCWSLNDRVLAGSPSGRTPIFDCNSPLSSWVLLARYP